MYVFGSVEQEASSVHVMGRALLPRVSHFVHKRKGQLQKPHSQGHSRHSDNNEHHLESQGKVMELSTYTDCGRSPNSGGW
ncbi:hypothetical protein BaRGS_00001774 [Batillaria attramentaria]|uniref:Uncharacterized protein n=1 Tax=Batillaria attramentaria TaxID=370345 RepID=A0ABD0M616_9CAEN